MTSFRAPNMHYLLIQFTTKFVKQNFLKSLFPSRQFLWSTSNYILQHNFKRSKCCEIVRKYSTVNICHKTEIIHVNSPTGINMKLPWVWLRDNCQCKECFNPQLQSRIVHWQHFDITVEPTSVSKAADTVSIKWSDGHSSDYKVQWLQDRSFHQESRENWLNTIYRPSKIPWSSLEFPNIINKFNFQDVLNSNMILYKWLNALAVYGIAIIEKTPPQKDQLQKLGNRVSFIKRTHYGEEFIVRNKPETTNLAYLSIPLQMHSDMPYYDYKPGVNMLHFLTQTVGNGGDNQFVDGLRISNYFKGNKPELYRILSTVPIEWTDVGKDSGHVFHSIYRAPVLCEDQWGQFARVNYNQWQRDSHFCVPLEDVIPWYKAQYEFTQALYNSKNMVQFKSLPGNIVTFDNTRILHGRSGYKDSKNNERYVIGSYMDWDVVYSRMRVLQRQLLLS